ncbi:MAG: murein biosynthesis integral membrane protein MurJ [Blastocatellia bacterium]|nr:murein biosynthesis integral membrane protein MurJ [Blastocatellia bacterium]
MNDAEANPKPEHQNPKPASVARSAGIVSIAVMGSRVLGLVRELIFAAFFGAGFATDAFIIAFRIPNLLRDLFGEGALSAAFVTTFTAKLNNEGEKSAWRLANLVNNGLFLVLSLIALLGIIFSPQIVSLLMDVSPKRGTIDPGTAALTFELAVQMTRIMFPFLLMISLAAVAMGVLNTKGIFGVPASASTMFNVGSIFGGLLCAYFMARDYIAGIVSAIIHGQPPQLSQQSAARAIIGMAIGTLIGGVCQWLIQVPSLRKVGYRWQPILSFKDEGVQQVMKLMAPAILGAAAVQVNVLVSTNFASSLGEGPVSWLNYAFRLIQFPIGVFGVAISTATITKTAREAAQGKLDEFRKTIASSLRLTMLMTIPSTIGLVVLAKPIIGMIYERGRFTASDTNQTADAMMFYALGLTAYSAIKVLAPAFYALKDTRIPMLASLLSIITNYFVAKLSIEYFGIGHRGLALSVSAVALINFAVLFFFLRRKLGGIEGWGLLLALIKIIAAALLMGAACYFLSEQLTRFIGGQSLFARIVNVMVSVGVGVLVFGVVAKVLRVSELEQLTATVMRKLGKKKAAPSPK